VSQGGQRAKEVLGHIISIEEASAVLKNAEKLAMASRTLVYEQNGSVFVVYSGYLCRRAKGYLGFISPYRNKCAIFTRI
jgi:hypothetical protein